jgi:hypothetical protein
MFFFTAQVFLDQGKKHIEFLASSLVSERYNAKTGQTEIGFLFSGWILELS